MAKFSSDNIIRVLNLEIQNQHIRHIFPEFRCTIKKGLAVWRGRFQPRMTSPAYLVEVQYKLKKTPKVWVLSPELHPDAVHLYMEKNLCLYWPKEWRWQASQLIAETVFPWTASWLYYYELWLDTGKWLGPSSHDYLPKTGR